MPATPMPATPFHIRNLSVLAYAQGFTLWHYRTDGATSGTLAPDFFSDAADMFATGDRIMVSGPSGALDLFILSVRPKVTVKRLRTT